MKEDNNKKKKTGDIPLVLLGLAASASFWVLEALIHAFVLDAEGFLEALLYPDPNELWMRLLIILIIVGSSFYASTIVAKLKLSESALRKERDTAQRYFDVSGVILVILDIDGRVLDINKKGCEILGREKARILGCDWVAEFVPAGIKGDVSAVFSDLISGGGNMAAYHENQIVSDTLGERYIAWQNIPLTDENGIIYATLSSGMDITERIRIQNELRESEEKYRLMIEESNDMIWAMDESGGVMFMNRRCEEASGYSLEELKGTAIDPYIVKEDLLIVKQAFERVMNGETVNYEARRRRRDDTVQIISVNSVPARKDGVIVGIVNFGRDITKERLATAELKERIEDLERFMKVTVDRELRMKELSDEIERLKGKKEFPATGRS
ncbi:MAG: PAS domain-containing protein [Deltaproteobacteria bacterium]